MSACQWLRNTDGHIELSGILTRNTVPALWKQKQEWLQGTEAVVLNLEQVEKIDSSGVAMLIEAKRELLAQQRELVIVEANQQLRAMVNVSGVETLLNLA